MSNQKYIKLNNGVDMPMAGIGTFLLTPDEAETSVTSALQAGYRLIDTANAYVNKHAYVIPACPHPYIRQVAYHDVPVFPVLELAVQDIFCL